MAYPRKGVRDQGIDYMCRVVDFAADLGGNSVIINPTRLTKWTPLAELEQELAWGAESIKVADYAAGQESSCLWKCGTDMTPICSTVPNRAAPLSKWSINPMWALCWILSI